MISILSKQPFVARSHGVSIMVLASWCGGSSGEDGGVSGLIEGVENLEEVLHDCEELL